MDADENPDDVVSEPLEPIVAIFHADSQLQEPRQPDSHGVTEKCLESIAKSANSMAKDREKIAKLIGAVTAFAGTFDVSRSL
jgi:hypothetical protein